MRDFRDRVFDVIEENWLTERPGPPPPTAEDGNLFNLGMADSLITMRIVALIEETYQVPIGSGSDAPEIFFALENVVKLHDQLASASVPGPSTA